MTNTRCCCYVCCGSHEGCYSSSYSWRIWMRNEVCSLILRCCFCCSWQSSLFLLSVVALVEEKERRILGKTSYLFSRLRVFASRFFVFLSTTRGRNVSSLRRRRFFFFSREQSVDDSCDSRRERRHDVSCVYRSSSLPSLSPSSRACTACGVFSKMVFYLSVKRWASSFMFWCIFFHCWEKLFILFLAKSHASSRRSGAPKKNYHHQSFYHHPIHDDGIKTQKVLHISLSSLLFASRYKRTHECSSNSVTNQSKANDRDVDCYDAIESIHSVRVHVLISQRY